MALSGYGVWALVGQYLSNTVINTLILAITIKWKLKFQISWKSIKELWKFGSKMLASTIVYTVKDNIRSLIIGKKFTSADLAWLNFTKILYYFIPIFLLGNLIFGKYSILVFGKEFPVYLTRNYLFVGLPYFLIGALIKQKIIDRKVFNWRGLNPYMVILFILTTLIERWLLVNFSVNATRDDYLSTTFLAIALFGLFFSYHYDDCKSNEKKVRIMLAEIGRYYSSWIYILHPIFITVIVDIVSKLNMYSKYIYVAPVVVYIVTTLFVMGFKYISGKRLIFSH